MFLASLKTSNKRKGIAALKACTGNFVLLHRPRRPPAGQAGQAVSGQFCHLLRLVPEAFFGFMR